MYIFQIGISHNSANVDQFRQRRKIVERIFKKLNPLAGHQPDVDLTLSDLQKGDYPDGTVKL
jgi:hypothetical protein